MNKNVSREIYGSSSATFYTKSLLDKLYDEKKIDVVQTVDLAVDVKSYGMFNTLELIHLFLLSDTTITAVTMQHKHIYDDSIVVFFTCQGWKSGDHILMDISVLEGNISISCASNNETQMVGLLRLLCEYIKINLKANDGICVNFTYHTKDGPRSFAKTLECPKWKDISKNYPSIRDDIRWLIDNEENKNGSLIIWHGSPGSGKTYSLLSLIKEWRNTEFTVVLDPEIFIDQSANFVDLIKEPTTGKGHCIIMEDAPNFILSESRSSKGDLISKMLNITSGLIGQGLNLKFIITTNEPIKNIDSAFRRPGRLLQLLEFPLFTGEQAADWLRSQDLGEDIINECSLADLYAVVNGTYNHIYADRCGEYFQAP